MATRQLDLFSGANTRKVISAVDVNSSVKNAVKRVDNSKKYIPHVILPQYSELRQRVLLLQNMVRQGKLIADPNIYMVNTQDELWKVVKNIIAEKDCVYDTETDDLDPNLAKFVGMSLRDPVTEKNIYIPSMHCDTQRNLLEGQLTYDQIMEVIGDMMQDDKIRKTGQNLVYDHRIMKNNFGIDVKGTWWDTLLFMNAVDENHKNNKLKNLYREYVLEEEGKSEDTFEALFGGLLFNFVPLDVATIYGGGDTLKTHAVREWQRKFLSKGEYKKMLEHYTTVEVKQLEIVTGMETRGISIDEGFGKELDVEYELLLQDLKYNLDTHFYNKFGIKNVNYSSPDQMAAIIYDKMKCDPVDKKKPRGTGAEIVEKLLDKNPDNAILKDLVTYRGTAKLLDTYIRSLPNCRAKHDNKVHGRFHSHGARTGRYSSAEPNLQNIPSHYNEVTKKDDSRIRQMFIATKGKVFISADYSQIEPRILAFRSDDAFMIEAYTSGRDLYALMASGVYKLPYEQCLESWEDGGKIRRGSMKSVLLGIMYGRQAKSIGVQLGMNAKDAERFIAKFFETYPNIKKYIDETVRMGTLLGYVTTICDRRRRLPDLNSPNEFVRAEAQRQGVNATIQGSSADITKKAMWLIHNDAWLNEHECYLVSTIHDEVLLEVPEQYIQEAGLRIKDLMVLGGDILKSKLPVKVDVEVYPRAWNKDGYKLKFAN